MCEYKFRDGEICKEEALPNTKYCILHIDLPEDTESTEFKKINELKEEKVKEKVNKGDFNFEGAKLLEIDFSKMEIEGIEGDVYFTDVVIIGDARFGNAEIGGDAWFDEAEIGGDAWFSKAKIGGDARFSNAKIGVVWFDEAEIGGQAWFDEAEIGAEIGGDACFSKAEIGGDAFFYKAKIGGDACFSKAEIGGDASFELLEVKGNLSFRDAVFEKPEAQEGSCRKAKRIWEEIGDRIEVDYYFYREMEAKRKQKYLHFSLKVLFSKLMVKLGLEKLIDKPKEIFGKERRIYWGFLELPVQYIFGYGVHPLRVVGWWLLTVLSLAIVYWLGNGVLVGGELEVAADSFGEYFYFSVVTAATPGYGGYKPVPGFYQALASFEAIFGTFMWAAFIATFARKYMR